MGIGKRTEWLGGAGAGCNWRRNDEAWDRLGDALEMVKAAAGPPHSKGCRSRSAEEQAAGLGDSPCATGFGRGRWSCG